MSRILITGSTGSIGRSFINTMVLEERITEDFRGVREEIRRKNPTCLIHLAANSTPEINAKHDDFLNVQSPRMLFEICQEVGIERFIFCSSGHVYGNHDKAVSEVDETYPISLYAEQKLKAEKLLESVSCFSSTNLIVARIFSIFGPGMRVKYLAGRLERQIKDQHRVDVWNSEDVRDFLSPAEASLYLSYLAKLKGVQHLEIINVCSGIPITIRKYLLKNFIEIDRLNFDYKSSEMPFLVGDNSKLNRSLIELTDLEKGLQK